VSYNKPEEEWFLFKYSFFTKGQDTDIRVLAGFQVTMILLTTTWEHSPNIVIPKSGGFLSLTGEAAKGAIHSLGMALLAGSAFILPALGYLIYSLQKNAAGQRRSNSAQLRQE
jgi:cytochrome d ubiquinol oxidase subunit II